MWIFPVSFFCFCLLILGIEWVFQIRRLWVSCISKVVFSKSEYGIPLFSTTNLALRSLVFCFFTRKTLPHTLHWISNLLLHRLMGGVLVVSCITRMNYWTLTILVVVACCNFERLQRYPSSVLFQCTGVVTSLCSHCYQCQKVH